jgi:hypothetical protein
MAKYLQRTKGGSIYLAWNHTRGYTQVGTKVLRPHDGSVSSSKPTAAVGNSLLFTSGSVVQDSVANLIEKGLVRVVEILTDDVLSVPFQVRRYGTRPVTADELRGVAPEPVIEESAPLTSPNVFEVPDEEPTPEPEVVPEPVVEEETVEEEPVEETAEVEEAPVVEEEELPWIQIADQELYDGIPWDALSEEKRDDLREWGKAFEPPISGVSKASIIEAMMEAKDFLDGE